MLSQKRSKGVLLYFVMVLFVACFLVSHAVLAEEQIGSEFAGGSGTEDDPYLIADAKQLDNVRNHLKSHFKLVSDIDLDIAPYNEGEGWEPIGDYEEPFRGSLDGNGKTIKGLYINREDMEDVGFFAWLGKGAVVRNVRLENVNVVGGDWVGALVGWGYKAQISNVHVSGSVAGRYQVGGLAGGINEDTYIDFSSSNCTVVGDADVGGLVGESSGLIGWCRSSGTVTGNEYVGGLLGSNGLFVVASYSTASVFGKELVGGLVGASWAEIIFACYASGEVTGSQYVGGLVGAVDNSHVAYSYAIGNVKGTNFVGGLVGYNYLGTIEDSYAAGAVSGESDCGGLVGINHGGAVIWGYYDKDKTGQSDTGKGEPKSTAEMMLRSTFENWFFVDIWCISDNAGYPMLRWQDEAPKSGFEALVPKGSAEPGAEVALKIFNAQGEDGELLVGRKEVTVYCETEGKKLFESSVEFTDGEAVVPITLEDLGSHMLRVFVKGVSYSALIPLEVLVVEFTGGSGTADVPYLIANVDDLYNVRYRLDAHFKLLNDIDLNVAPYNEGEGWLPIGTSNGQFFGYFDGNGKTISGLYINRLNEGDVGFFGSLGKGATVTNLTLEDVSVTASSYVGAFVGWNSRGQIINCVASGVVRGISDIGGLVGGNDGEIADSYATCLVTGETYIGGLAGYSTREVARSHAAGDVMGRKEVGGLLGYNEGKVNNCHATATVKGEEKAGGLVGLNWEGQIMNSYSAGFVVGDRKTGGLVGKNTGDITDCFATGAVSGEHGTGGLVGRNYGKITGSYAVGSVVGNEVVGGLVGHNEGSIANCHAKGNVLGAYSVGGLIGNNDKGQVTNSYTTGVARGIEDVDELIGVDVE